jgi:UPF0755 protein
LRSLFRLGLASALLGLLALGSYLYWFSIHPLNPEPKIYVVKPGSSLRAFTTDLYEQNVLPDKFALVWLAYLKGQSRDLKAGEYRFRKGITALELLNQVIAGRVVEYPFTIIEGWTFQQILQALAAAPRLTHTARELGPRQIMASLGYPNLHPEGHFYPDTYYYPGGMSDLLILQRAFQKMDAHLQQEWENRDKTSPLHNRDEALILASIIEKETARAEERGLIAGVMVNRLRKGMKLQTDPTVIYGMGERFSGNLRSQDLKTYTPYNTYIIKALPPTPIAMPSGDAVRAALNPAVTKALYFVSRGDGSHEFSETLEQHNKAVIKYQLGGKAKTAATMPQAPR